MHKAPTSGGNTTAAPDIEANGASFARHMRAANKSSMTIKSYVGVVKTHLRRRTGHHLRLGMKTLPPAWSSNTLPPAWTVTVPPPATKSASRASRHCWSLLHCLMRFSRSATLIRPSSLLFP